MKQVRMSISHFRFILFYLKIIGETVTTKKVWIQPWIKLAQTTE